MREIHVDDIKNTVAKLCVKANIHLPHGMREIIEASTKAEKSETGKNVLSDLVRNLDAAAELDVPICQDTGMAVVFADIGQEVHIVGGDFEKAVNDGVEKGYTEGYLRLSIVSDPLERKNTNTNTPAVIHTRIVSGDRLHISVSPKGFGSENMSALKMFTPAANREDIISFVLETVSRAGSNPCPPITVGIGIGGNFEYSAFLAKKALCRDMHVRNANPFYAELEKELLDRINMLGIGPQGFGGTTTALYVNIETFGTHIAGLPVAVNMGCHVNRHAEATL